MSDVLRFRSPDPSFDVSDVIHEVCDAFEISSFHRGVHLEADVPPYTILHGDREPFRQVLELLVARALEITPRGGEVVVTAFREAGGVEVEVADSGVGIADVLPGNQSDFAQELREQKRSKGWAEIQRAVTALGGEISPGPRHDAGAAVTVHFPQHLKRAAA